MSEEAEQRICMKFRKKLGHSCSETYDMIQKNFGNGAMGHKQVKEWFRRFKAGLTSIESDERSGRPSMSTNQLVIDKVRSAMLDN
jgi:transposase